VSLRLVAVGGGSLVGRGSRVRVGALVVAAEGRGGGGVARRSRLRRSGRLLGVGGSGLVVIILGDILAAVLLGGGRRLVRAVVDVLVGVAGVAVVLVVLAGRGINLDATLTLTLGSATGGTTNRAGNTALARCTRLNATLAGGTSTSTSPSLNTALAGSTSGAVDVAVDASGETTVARGTETDLTHRLRNDRGIGRIDQIFQVLECFLGGRIMSPRLKTA
jgi:hypothetical protein